MRSWRKKEIVIVRPTINDELYEYLIQLLNERFYTITDLEELTKINRLFKALNHQTESWLSAISSGKSNSKDSEKIMKN